MRYYLAAFAVMFPAVFGLMEAGVPWYIAGPVGGVISSIVGTAFSEATN